ncbi:MAG: hypothetical protein M1828_006865 [Chrysothrix sp. TS-e1954]|nr:MAG: hypothetical protein M1828_006865 [Chrysothrix sp. TS-e1954]
MAHTMSGLACDTVLRYTLVLPNGEIRDVDETSKDLFFALKGGLNRFGIVTEMVYRTVPQPDEIYGGYKVFTRGQIPALINATNEFSSENKDPKAQVILIIRKVASTTIGIVLFYYGGPHGPAAFAPFNNVWSVYRNVTSGSFLDFAEIMDSDTSASSRGAYHSVPTTRFTKTYLNAVHNETIFHGDPASPHSGTSIYYSVQPFTENYGLLAADSAFPHNDSPQQLNLYYSWSSAADDAYWQRTMQQSVDHLTAIAKAEGIYSPDFSTYPNYAPSHYTWDQVYGATNAARLRSIRAKVDPDMVMELAGGFRS